jgi:hypothetical protein
MTVDPKEMDQNFRYDSIILAAEYNNVIHHLKLHYHPDISNLVDMVMKEKTIRTLIEFRDNLLQQGLNGLKENENVAK